MVHKNEPGEDADFFSLPMAKWVVGVLDLLIAVVGGETLVGLILQQTRSEIAGLIRDEEKMANYQPHPWFMNN